MLGIGLLILTTAAAPPPQDFPVAWWHDRQSIEVSTGDTVTVRLECRPGTGYGWHERVSDRAVLAEREPPRLERPDRAGDRLGDVELQVFRYLAARPGVARFSAACRRGDGTPAIRSFEVTVEVWGR